jgi:hypothetical protein
VSLTEPRWDMPLNVDAAILRSEWRDGLSVTWMASSCHVRPSSERLASRAPGERANAQLRSWRTLRKLRCCPWRAGQLAKAIHVLQTRGIGG